MVMMTSILMVLLSVKQSLKSLISIKPKEFNHEKAVSLCFFFFYGADIGGCTGASAPGSEAVCAYKVNRSNNALNHIGNTALQ